MEVYDCIVVGIGGHGSASLAYLAKEGQKVLGLEQFKPVHKHGMHVLHIAISGCNMTHARSQLAFFCTTGSSHGRTRIYRQAYYEDPRCMIFL